MEATVLASPLAFIGQESPSKKLKFGIESILEPNFGQCTRDESTCSSSPHLASPGGMSPTSSTGTSPPSSDPRSMFPAWIFCTRYSDRPSAGPRTRKPRKREQQQQMSDDEKRPRTAFTPSQLDRLKKQFLDNRYLTEKRRQELAHELGLNESQIKIWFQNKRAKLKKATGDRSSFAMQMMTQAMYSRTAAMRQ